MARTSAFVDMENPLLQLFMERLETELVDQMLATVRPQAVEFARRIVKEMEPAVLREYDVMRDKTLFMFRVTELVDASGTS